MPARTTRPTAEPQSAGIVERTSSPSIRPASAQAQIHRSSTPREKPARIGAPSMAPRINWSAMGMNSYPVHLVFIVEPGIEWGRKEIFDAVGVDPDNDDAPAHQRRRIVA